MSSPFSRVCTISLYVLCTGLYIQTGVSFSRSPFNLPVIPCRARHILYRRFLLGKGGMGMKRLVVPWLCGLLIGCMACFPREAAEAVIYACDLWARAVMPSLFPFLACMLLITGNWRLSEKNGMNKFLGLPSRAVPVGLMGLVSGSPGGARLSQTLRLDGEAGRAALMRLSLYTGVMSPMFFIGTIAGWLKSPALGYVILLSHWLGAFFTGQLSRLFFPCPPLENPPYSPEKPPGLAQVMQSAAMAMLTVCGLMALGSVAAQMARCALPGLPPAALAALQSALEVTAGCARILDLPLPQTIPGLRPALLCAATSFGGLSILLQNLAFLQERGVAFSFLLKGRLCHGGLSFGLCLLLYPLAGVPALPAWSPPVLLPSAFSPVLLGGWFLCLLPIWNIKKK